MLCKIERRTCDGSAPRAFGNLRRKRESMDFGISLQYSGKEAFFQLGNVMEKEVNTGK
jgi:hypothetical protein